MFSDKSFEKFNIKDYQRLFLLGAVLGGLLFMLVYGVAVINPSYTQWIFYADYDLRQHFIGWCSYRNTPWKFPVGLIDTLSYPISISTIYTDSIPGVALIFKIFSGILPRDFQYFGLIGLLFYMLSGGTSVVLLKRFIKSPWICLMVTPIFVVSFPMIQRMFYHTALAAQWIIFLCLIIWAYDPFLEKSRKPVIYWGIMGFVCVSIHSYFLPMAGMIMLSDRITWYFVNKDVKRGKRIPKALLPIGSFCAAAILALWFYGGFYGSSSGVAAGLGTFGANFNTFINPGYYGAIFPEMGYENYFQYEGCGYLGLGIILMSVFVDVMLIVKLKKASIRRVMSSNKQKIYLFTSLGLFVVSFLCSTLPKISWGTWNIVSIPLPDPVYRAASVFRSNGRFIWIDVYLIMLYTVVLGIRFLQEYIRISEGSEGKVLRLKGNSLIYAVLIIVLLIQGADLSKMIKEKHDLYSKSDYTYSTLWDTDEDILRIINKKRYFVFLNTDSNINMETAFYAYKHNMYMNSFYFARDINKEVNDNINIYKDELMEGLVRSDTIYIVKQEEYSEIAEGLKDADILEKEFNGNIIFASK